MKKVLIALLLVIVSCTFRPDPKPTQPTNHLFVDVVTYNIKIGLKDFNKVEQNLHELNADIVLLQEVYLNQAQYLTQQLQMNGSFYQSKDTQWGPYGLAILSKYPFSGHAATYALINPPGEEQKILAGAEILFPTGPADDLYRGLWVWNTHLISNSKTKQIDVSKVRLQQAEQVTGHIYKIAQDENGQNIVRENGGGFVTHYDTLLLGGDFNSWGLSKTKSHFQDYFLDTFDEFGKGLGATFPNYLPVLRLDYIFLHEDTGFGGKEDRFEAVESKVLRSGGSDHFPLWTRIKIKFDAVP